MRYMLEIYVHRNPWPCYLPHHFCARHFLLHGCILLIVLSSMIGSHICRFKGCVASIQARSCNEMGFPSYFDNKHNSYCVSLTCNLASFHRYTCDSFVYNVFFRKMHFTRANCFLSLQMDIHTWNHDLAEVRYTHVRDIISHCKHITREYNMANNIL